MMEPIGFIVYHVGLALVSSGIGMSIGSLCNPSKRSKMLLLMLSSIIIVIIIEPVINNLWLHQNWIPDSFLGSVTINTFEGVFMFLGFIIGATRLYKIKDDKND